jgi:hypothetical protein
MRRRRTAAVLAALGLAAAAVGTTIGVASGPDEATSASHREAPLVSQDPSADISDFYLFTDPNDSDYVTAIVDVQPFAEPGAGPNWYAFSDAALYAIHFDNDGDGKPNVSYEFKFKTQKASLSNALPLGCVAGKCQSYNVWRVVNGKGSQIVSNAPVPATDIGPRTRGTFQKVNSYQEVRDAAIKTTKRGGLVFAGPADDPFFGDIGAAFDGVGFRSGTGNKGGGKDTFAGFNVHTIAIQIPKQDVRGAGDVVGAWAAVYRPKAGVGERAVKGASEYRSNRVTYVQVNRLGNPLMNELFPTTNVKDAWNASTPDKDKQWDKYLTKPGLAAVVNSLYASLDLGIQEDNRTDLLAAFHTGLPGLNELSKNGAHADLLRLNLTTPVAASPNRLTALGGDTQGWPNGRRLQDDVVDVALIALGGALLPTPKVLPLGDGVNANDRAFGQKFPYVALPHEGFANSHGVLQPVTP